jgi:hypothetical protein
MSLANFICRKMPIVVLFTVGFLGQDSPARANLVLPFTENFTNDASGWVALSNTPPNWTATGGADGDGFISMSQTIGGGGGFGAIIFRGNAGNNASNGGFVGNWIDRGVTLFSALVRHDAPEPVSMFIRLDRGFGAGGSTQAFLVPGGNVWTQLLVPIVDSNSVFQSYGTGNFESVFSNIQNIQIALSSTQTASLVGNTYTFGLDRVSVVPEPSSIGLCLLGLTCAGFYSRCRKQEN